MSGLLYQGDVFGLSYGGLLQLMYASITSDLPLRR